MADVTTAAVVAAAVSSGVTLVGNFQQQQQGCVLRAGPRGGSNFASIAGSTTGPLLTQPMACTQELKRCEALAILHGWLGPKQPKIYPITCGSAQEKRTNATKQHAEQSFLAAHACACAYQRPGKSVASAATTRLALIALRLPHSSHEVPGAL